MDELNTIIKTDLPEIEKLAQAFEWVTDRFIEQAQKEIELARALGDQETVIKEHIKTEVMRHARSIFQDCYRRVTRRSTWDE